MTVEIGKKAPDFSMKTAEGNEISLADFKGKKLVLYFYPKDDTPGCTKEACGFRDSFAAFQGEDVEVVGISRDSTASHEKFKSKYDLPFTLATDEGDVSEAYDTWVEKNMYGKKYMGMERATFLIDEDGVVQAEWRKVKVPGHVEAVLEKARSL